MERSEDDTALYLLRIRQIELQRRRLRLTGTGREFDHLRDYRAGDEMRNISWPATARRAKVVTREFTTERSQQVWIILDAGRLSGTVFEIRRAPAMAAPSSPAPTFRDAAADESFSSASPNSTRPAAQASPSRKPSCRPATRPDSCLWPRHPAAASARRRRNRVAHNDRCALHGPRRRL